MEVASEVAQRSLVFIRDLVPICKIRTLRTAHAFNI